MSQTGIEPAQAEGRTSEDYSGVVAQYLAIRRGHDRLIRAGRHLQRSVPPLPARTYATARSSGEYIGATSLRRSAAMRVS